MQDYGLVDILRTAFSQTPDYTDTDFGPFGEGEAERAYFLPWQMGHDAAKRYGLVPNDGYIAYRSPPGMVNPDPHVSRRVMRDIVEDFLSRGVTPRRVVGYSVGIYPATQVAAEVEEAVFVAPGDELGWCIRNGIATQDARRRYEGMGYSHGAYDAIIGDTNPIHNVERLPDDITVYLASHDRYIRPAHGRRLVAAMRRSGNDPDVVSFDSTGHVCAHLKAAEMIH